VRKLNRHKYQRKSEGGRGLEAKSEPRSEKTLLLDADEVKPMRQRIRDTVSLIVTVFIAWFFVIILTGTFGQTQFAFTLAQIIFVFCAPLLYFLLARKNKFSLYEGGVGIRHTLARDEFHRWGSFHSFTVDDSKKQFKLKKSIGSILLTLTENFIEVRRILSEHISSPHK
jgi:hypothetical protein